MKLIYLLIPLLLLFYSSTDSQNHLTNNNAKKSKLSSETYVSFVVNSSKTLEIYDLNGEIMYNINQGSLQTAKNKPASLNNTKFVGKIDFSKTDLPISVDGKFSFYDSQGQNLFTINSSFTNIFPAKDNHYLTSKYNRSNRSNEYQFLSRKFKASFEYPPFNFATEFYDNKAVVGSKGKIFVIDSKGKEIAVLPEHISQNVIDVHEIKESLIRIDIEIDGYKTTEFYDLNTQELIRRSDGQYFGISKEFINGKSLSTSKNEIVTFNKKGEILGRKANVEIINRNQNFIYLYDIKTRNTQLYNYLLEPIDSLNSSNFIRIDHINEKFISTISNVGGHSKYTIRDPNSLQIIFESDVPIMDRIKTTWICGSYGINSSKLKFIGVHKSNAELSKSKFENFIYTNLVQCSKNPKEVKNAELFIGDRNNITSQFHWQREFIDDHKNLSQINNLTELENLLLMGNSKLNDIDFRQLDNLKSLWIIGNKELFSLPTTFSSNKLLENLQIDNCPNLKNIDNSILKIPNLKRLSLGDIELNQNTIKKLKAKNEDINIEMTSIQ